MTNDYSRGLVASPDYLAHYGTKGMKWGERKYQYEDGTLTPQGKLRYLRSQSGGHDVMSYKQYRKSAFRSADGRYDKNSKEVSKRAKYNASKSRMNGVCTAGIGVGGAVALGSMLIGRASLGGAILLGAGMNYVMNRLVFSRQEEDAIKDEYNKYLDQKISDLKK